jgi:hypothetical protein
VEVKHVSKPEWLTEWKKRMRIIEVIEKAYEVNCDCEVCRQMRALGEELGEMFTSQVGAQMPFTAPGGVDLRQKKKKYA